MKEILSIQVLVMGLWMSVAFQGGIEERVNMMVDVVLVLIVELRIYRSFERMESGQMKRLPQ